MVTLFRNILRPKGILSKTSLITQIVLLNLMDALLTLYATLLGVGELNPIMASLLEAGALVFIVVKVGLITPLVFLINKLPAHQSARLYIFLASVYWLVMTWHIFGVVALHGAF